MYAGSWHDLETHGRWNGLRQRNNMDFSEYNQQHVDFFMASTDAIIATSVNEFEITLARREHERVHAEDVDFSRH